MPDRDFLENCPLYSKFRFSVPTTLGELPDVAIHMYCSVCQSDQTFVKVADYGPALRGIMDGRSTPANGQLVWIDYRCVACNECHRHFLVRLSDDGQGIMKIGQYPAWDIAGDPHVEALLEDHAYYFKRGLICESQSYGIAAFAYYRRIVEEIIDGLLDEIARVLVGKELEEYTQALAKAKETTVASEKIKLVKDLLPESLRPGDVNPLGTLYEVLSRGIHAESDDECMEMAGAVREVLTCLTSQLASYQSASRTLTEHMKRLLDRKKGAAR